MSNNPPPPPFDVLSRDGLLTGSAQQEAEAVQPPPAATASGSNVAAHSVVPDLMKVYESLTQSSTPQSQFPPDGGGSQGMHGWTYDTTSVPTSSFAVTDYSGQQQQQPEETVSSSSRGRSLRKRTAAQTSQDESSASGSDHAHGGGGGGGRGSKSRKKNGKDPDGRWSKRFTWPDDLHRDFVSAVFDVGLKHSSPSTILENMPKLEQITTERIKSHLQKYRVHREKSKKEFMSSYEATLNKLQKDGGTSGLKSLAGGEVAGHLAYSTLTDGNLSTTEATGVGANNESGDADAATKRSSLDTSSSGMKKPAAQQQDTLLLPRLTEQEKQSPIGASMGYLMGLFFSLKQQLTAQRAARAAEEARAKQPVAAVFDSFVAGSPGSGDIAAAAPSTRTNLEQSNIMKREMEGQMAFQNKMRALKQQELKKYSSGATEESGKHARAASDMGQGRDMETVKAAEGAEQHQGAGEAVADGGHPHHGHREGGSMPQIAAEDFWNSDVVDEQLFEFLLNDS